MSALAMLAMMDCTSLTLMRSSVAPVVSERRNLRAR